LVSPMVMRSMTEPPAIIIRNSVEKTIIANGLTFISLYTFLQPRVDLHGVIVLLTFDACVPSGTFTSPTFILSYLLLERTCSSAVTRCRGRAGVVGFVTRLGEGTVFCSRKDGGSLGV
jgi:hypothetical protein